VPGAPTQVSVSDESITLSINANGNPASNPTTYFAIQVSATDDGTWLNQYADATGNPNASAQWLTAAQLTNFVVQGLQPSTSYTFRVKARNQDTDETAFGSTATMSTVSPINPETRIQGGTRLQGIRIY
jgi:phosphodiesterase/alkaline phosphatase D-like protein